MRGAIKPITNKVIHNFGHHHAFWLPSLPNWFSMCAAVYVHALHVRKSLGGGTAFIQGLRICLSNTAHCALCCCSSVFLVAAGTWNQSCSSPCLLIKMLPSTSLSRSVSGFWDDRFTGLGFADLNNRFHRPVCPACVLWISAFSFLDDVGPAVWPCYTGQPDTVCADAACHYSLGTVGMVKAWTSLATSCVPHHECQRYAVHVL